MKQRLDTLLCEKGLCTSREKAKAVIMSGIVYVDNQKADKPGQMIDDSKNIEIRGSTLKFVSRGGLKIEKALDRFNIDPQNVVAMDIGASTGGFTDCLLKRGALKVYSIDVGYGQLAWSLRSDPRVVCMERTNIRKVTPEDLAEIPSLAVIDVSFISLKLVLPVVSNLIDAEKAEIACLIKPQFEAGREKVGKKGVVRDRAVHEEVLHNFVQNAEDAGFFVHDITYSPIKGPEGNIEFLGHLKRYKNEIEIDIEKLVSNAHDELIEGKA